MKPHDYIDIVKAFGKQDYVIYKNDYREKIKSHPLVNGLWTVGSWFSFVANTHTWDVEFVAGDSLGVVGYTRNEILRRNSQFVSNFIYQEDYPFITQVIHLAMNYVNDLPVEERPYVYVVFYARAVGKDGRVIMIQNQNAPIVFDERNIPFIFANIITDISHLHPANIPNAVVINKKADKHFHLDGAHLKLEPRRSIFTERELQIVKGLIKGQNSRKIGESLGISHETVRTHRKNILQKAKLKSATELVSYAMLHKVV